MARLGTVGASPPYTPGVLARVPRLAVRMALTAVALVLAHNLIFLVTYGAGAGAALARTGHDARWGDAATVVLALGGTLLTAGAWRLWRLARRVRDLERSGLRPRVRNGHSLIRTVLRFWVVIAPLSAALLVAQENIEHLSVGLPLPLLGVLYSAEYPVTVPVVALVALAIAAVAGLFAMRVAALQARVAELTLRHRRVPAGRRRPAWPQRVATSILGCRMAGRAPPLVA